VTRTIAGLPYLAFLEKEKHMPRIVAGPAGRGSQKWLQVLVNDHSDLLDRVLAAKLGMNAEQIRWVSYQIRMNPDR
jgi:hypothetical protein